MSIQNFPRVSVDTSKFDLPVFTPAVAPVRIPTKTYDLVVSLGTDVHTFDRLLRWVEAYLEAHPKVTCLVQHGHTALHLHPGDFCSTAERGTAGSARWQDPP